ncbi:MAG: Jag N-terminal domain-containing protein, partial [Poseidonibacter sp.]|uniref:Jag N-terminal domain-containing protein n=1 Tax=Poseidonibacter sp. TaxID=2321188 RepID=UPI00359DA69F
MKKFEAKCLQEVYELASADFNCSITDLDIEVIQQPSKGFLGFGKKNAIIQVCFKDNCKTYTKETRSETFMKKDIKIEDVSSKIEESRKN